MKFTTTPSSWLFPVILITFSSCFLSCESFAPVQPSFRSITPYTTSTVPHNNNGITLQHPSLARQRHSIAPVQTAGLFGLGAPEIAIILVAAAFLLGPQKLAELGKDAGKIAGELKEVPKEFQKGLAEGEESAKALKEQNEDVVDVEKKEKE